MSTQLGTLTVASGHVTVNSRSREAVDAELDIKLESTVGDHIAITGDVIETNCTPRQVKSCP